MATKRITFDRKRPDVAIAKLNEYLNNMREETNGVEKRVDKIVISASTLDADYNEFKQQTQSDIADLSDDYEDLNDDYGKFKHTTRADISVIAGAFDSDTFESDYLSVLEDHIEDDIGIVGSSVLPNMDGTASAGSAKSYSRSDHIHPSDTSKVDAEEGKGLSSNDYVDGDKDKVDLLVFTNGVIDTSILPPLPDENDYPEALSITTGDFIRILVSGVAKRIDYAALAKAIIENYNGSTIAGSAQSAKSAIDTISTRIGRINEVARESTSSAAGTTKTYTLSSGEIYLLIVGQYAVAGEIAAYVIIPHSTKPSIVPLVTSTVVSASMSSTTLSVSFTANYNKLVLYRL